MDATNKAVPGEFGGLRKLAEVATPGPWEADSIKSDGEYGTDDDGGYGYTSYAVTDDKGRCIVDCLNNDNGMVQVENDGFAFDAVAKRNAAYIAAANPATILRLLDALEATQPQPAAVRAPSDERVAFEAWATKQEPGHHLHWNLTNSSAQRYSNDRGQHTYEGFIGGLAAARAAAPVSGPTFNHPDDSAVDRFAAAMKAKMATQRAKGYGGWDNEALCTDESLAEKLMRHTQKGDPVDVANFAMMLHQRHNGDNYIVGDVLKIAALDFAKRTASAFLPEPAAPVSGQGASIDTPEFRKLLRAYKNTNWHSADEIAALVAYIDTRAAASRNAGVMDTIEQARANFEDWYVTHIEDAEIGSADCAARWSAWLAGSTGNYKAPGGRKIAPMPWSAPVAAREENSEQAKDAHAFEFSHKGESISFDGYEEWTLPLTYKRLAPLAMELARRLQSTAPDTSAPADSSSAAPSDAGQVMEAAWTRFMETEAFVGCTDKFIFGGGYRAALAAPSPTKESLSAEVLACWSCKRPYTAEQRMDADGMCPHCGVEIELDDAVPGEPT